MWFFVHFSIFTDYHHQWSTTIDIEIRSPVIMPITSFSFIHLPFHIVFPTITLKVIPPMYPSLMPRRRA